jgi:hypothetical protein
MSTKIKNDERRPSQLAFMALWVGSYIVLWLVLWTVLEIWVYRRLPFEAAGAVCISLALVPLTAFMQKLAIQRFLGHSIRAWFRTDILGGFLSMMVFAFGADAIKNNMLMASLLLFTPLAFLQMLCLWPHVKSAWLWLLASIVAALSFAFPFRDYDKLLASHMLSFVILGLGLVHGTVQGVIMRYLWTQPRTLNKQKISHTPDESQEAGERLGLSEDPDLLADGELLTKKKTHEIHLS